MVYCADSRTPGWQMPGAEALPENPPLERLYILRPEKGRHGTGKA